MRYMLGFLGVIALIIVVLVLIIRGLSGDDAVKDLKPLTDYTNTDTVMQFTAEGQIDADVVHQSLRISVSRTEARAEILQGYNDTVVDTISYPNNSEAYGVFLRALDLQQFNRGNPSETLKDERGFCADGNLYLFEIKENGQEAQRFWKTSCGEGNFGGNPAKIEQLFKAQIPDLGNFARNVNL